MATAEPTRADDADPGPENGPRIRLSEPRGRDSGDESKGSKGSADTGGDLGRRPGHPDGRHEGRPEPAPPVTRARAAFLALRERMLRHPALSVMGVAGTLHIVWFFTFANSGGDLAAQDAWAEFVGRHPDSAYNLAWYGGMHPVSYSVVSPYLMSVLGVRTTMMIAGTVSAGLLTMILIRSLPHSRLRSSGGTPVVRNPLWAALAGVYAFLCNAASGRVTFGLGTMFALGAIAAVFCWPYRWRYKRWAKALCAAPLAALATMASPVAGLFVGLVAVALFLQKRRPGAWSLGLAPSAVVALSAWLFPFSGTQPMRFASVILPVVFSILVYVLVPNDWKTVRITAAVYGLSVILVWLISSQIGSNITRLAMLFAGVVLAAALPFAVPRSRKWYAIVVAFAGFTVWIGYKSVDDVVNTAPAASWSRELAPLVNELQEVGAEKGRVEVVPARSHREASALAPYVNLARGWNRQADMERNPLFYDDTLNSANYHEWLERWAVHFVVLPKDKPDGDGGERERALVQRGLPYLTQIWGDANWQLFRVTAPTPLAEPHAVVQRAAQGEMTMDVKKAGRVLIRIPYSPWLSIVDAKGKKLAPPQETAASKERPEGMPKSYDNVNGCLMETAEDAEGDRWTVLVAPEAGTYRLAAPYQLPRGTPCPEELR
ncbi:MFS transporter [Streptomyces sp. TRM68367]|uniref:MFS transporter n=1 Tax=Streptomyces sp. TRM68367 TaxID=2758415 RepID=UPI00165ADBCF|nr:MFS transporter [Streptomyces sp. TRM68367]MBC9727557.1 MFS transporter [Streptomyces sp. TRM68367]